ncbi:MAG: hypothetical protein AB8G17_11505 [Gammaproteobacteria bacterium]
MYKRLDRLYVVSSVCFVALISGCASGPQADSSATSDTITTRTGKAVTTFEEQTVAALSDEEFWTKGEEATIDENGRLVYHVSQQVIEDGNYNRGQLEQYRPRATGIRYDPITGYPILQQPIRRPRNPEGITRPQTVQPTVQSAPRARSPVVNEPRRSTSDSNRNNRDSRR